MKIFFRWTFKAFLFLLLIGLTTAAGMGFKNVHITDGIAFIIAGSFFLGGFFYLLEAKWIPARKIRLAKKIGGMFESRPVTDTITHFKYGMIDVYTEVEYNMSMSQYQGGLELISFHIPRDQVQYVFSDKKSKFKQSHCNGIPTYLVYQTNSMGLGLAKKRLSKILI